MGWQGPGPVDADIDRGVHLQRELHVRARRRVELKPLRELCSEGLSEDLKHAR